MITVHMGARGASICHYHSNLYYICAYFVLFEIVLWLRDRLRLVNQCREIATAVIW